MDLPGSCGVVCGPLHRSGPESFTCQKGFVRVNKFVALEFCPGGHPVIPLKS